MHQLPAKTLPLACPAGNGVRKSDANKKRESRLNCIVKTHSRPLNVRLIVRKDAPENAIGKRVCNRGKVQYLSHHEHHHEATIRVDGDIARGRRCCGPLGCSRPIGCNVLRCDCRSHSHRPQSLAPTAFPWRQPRILPRSQEAIVR